MRTAFEPEIVQPGDRPWLELSPGNFIQVLLVDEDANRVAYAFRVPPGERSPRHRHHCDAIAYTIRGSWDYDTGPSPAGSLAYEPSGTEHEYTSEDGAEVFVCLQGDSDLLLENLLPDGRVMRMDTAFFKALQKADQADVRGIVAASLGAPSNPWSGQPTPTEPKGNTQ